MTRTRRPAIFGGAATLPQRFAEWHPAVLARYLTEYLPPTWRQREPGPGNLIAVTRAQKLYRFAGCSRWAIYCRDYLHASVAEADTILAGRPWQPPVPPVPLAEAASALPNHRASAQVPRAPPPHAADAGRAAAPPPAPSLRLHRASNPNGVTVLTSYDDDLTFDTGPRGHASGPWLSWHPKAREDGSVPGCSWALHTKRDDYEPIAPEQVILHLPSLRTGWCERAMPPAGQHRERQYGPSPARMPPDPGPDWTECVVVRVAVVIDGEHLAATWEGHGVGTWAAYRALAGILATPAVRAARQPDTCPVFAVTGFQKMGRTAAPTFAWVGWEPTPDCLLGVGDEPEDDAADDAPPQVRQQQSRVLAQAAQPAAGAPAARRSAPVEVADAEDPAVAAKASVARLRAKFGKPAAA